MLYLLVQVTENVKCIIPERIISINPTNKKFCDLFNAITLEQYDQHEYNEVKVFIRREKLEGWKEVDNRLEGDLKMLEVLGFLQVKFCLVSNINSDMDIPTQEKLNAFSILMNNSYQPLLPQKCTEYNNCNRLYNEIIELFRTHKVGWMGGIHDTVGKTFVNRIMNAIWYIDPHLSTLSARSYHLPVFFTQLKTYQDGETYNKFYHTSHHKKNPLSQQKLTHLSDSLELSINQPWASNSIWDPIMPSVLSLIEILKKYAEYLNTTNNSMIKLHNSDESARNPENDCTMYRVDACKKLNNVYSRLNDALLEKPFYEYIDIQQYLPVDIMKRHRFIKELQLTFPIGIYRLVFTYNNDFIICS